MKFNRGFLVAAAAVTASVLFFGHHSIMAKDADVIPNGITIDGHDVSGMTEAQAEAVLDDILSQYTGTTFTLKAEDRTVEVTSTDLGIRPKSDDVVAKALSYGKEGNLIERFVAKSELAGGQTKDFDLTLTADVGQVSELLENRSEELDTKAKNYGLKRENGQFVITEGQNGVEVKIDESALAIADYISDTWTGGDATIDLVTEVEEPRGKKEDLEQVKDVLGTYNTDFSTSSAARANNVSNGTRLINGSVLYPGDEFSVAAHLNPMTAENGYQPAPSYENGATVETYGGGICQVSSTLYNAVMRAELEIVTRSAHSMIVSYVEPSMDAAIAGDAKDFVFKNNKEFPVYIDGYTSGGRIYFTVYGKETRDPNRTVEFESEVIEQIDPISTYSASEELPVGTITRTSGSAHTGYTARLWKIVKENGKEVSRDIYNNSKYRVTNNTYVVGVASDNPKAVAAMNEAIATQDTETINAAAAKWADGAQTGEAEDKTDKKTEDKKKKDTVSEDTPSESVETDVEDDTEEVDTSDEEE
ncbi:MAG: VanW family protein [Lachnospiraceae bacterium]|nr:VanW family protein [Lachnospiraceae bacterium]